MPSGASLFAATTAGDYEQDYRRFRLLCLVVTLASLPTLCHMFGLSPTATLIMDLRKLAVLAAIVLYSVQPVFLLIGPNGTQVHIAAIISAGTATLLTAAWIDLYGRGRGRREDLEPR